MKRKKRSLQKPSPENFNGQKGHIGETLRQSLTPYHVVKLKAESCSNCNHSLEYGSTNFENRQLFDIPIQKIEVTEYQRHIIVCPFCKQTRVASYSELIRGSNQLNPTIQTYSGYLSYHPIIPLNRFRELFKFLFDVSVRETTLLKWQKRVMNFF